MDCAGRTACRLTNLLTRRCGTEETARNVGDAHGADSLVSETRRDDGDGGDVRRSAHNPEVGGSKLPPATRETPPEIFSPGAFRMFR